MNGAGWVMLRDDERGRQNLDEAHRIVKDALSSMPKLDRKHPDCNVSIHEQSTPSSAVHRASSASCNACTAGNQPWLDWREIIVGGAFIGYESGRRTVRTIGGSTVTSTQRNDALLRVPGAAGLCKSRVCWSESCTGTFRVISLSVDEER
jgi:hypothetical protein